MKVSMKKIALLALLICVALILCACKGQEGQQQDPTSEPTQKSVLDINQDVPATNPDDLPEGYDPASEEENSQGYMPNEAGAANKVYAGATPVPLDPIDKPTATPRPELTFTYTQAQADALGVKFEIPGNWVRDDSQTGIVVFTDPTTLDNVNATVTIKLASVGSDYEVSDVKADVEAEMALIGQYNYTDWSTTDCTERTIMGKDGYYADYRGVQVDGTIVRGRVQMALLDGGKLLTIEYNAPGWFNSSYKKVFDQLRSTLEAL